MSTSISSFISYQNGVRQGLGLPANWLFTTDGSGGSNTAVGWGNGTLSSGHNNAVLLDSPRTQYQIQVDGTGALVMKDATSGQSVNVTGETEIIFNGASATTPGLYDQMVLVEHGQDAALARLYQATFGRIPDLPGLEQWKNALDVGALALDQIAQGFIASQEFSTRFGSNTSNPEFVTTLYQNVLGRAPDATGLAGWVAELDNGSQTRSQVLLGFTNSKECISDVSSWLVDTSTGGFADAGMTLPAGTVLNQGTVNKYINLSLIDPTTIGTGAHSTDYQGDGFAIATSGAAIAARTTSTGTVNILLSGDNGTTIALSTAINGANLYGSGDTIYNSSSPQSGLQRIFIAGNNDTIVLGNPVATVVGMGTVNGGSAPFPLPISTTVYGFIPGTDVIQVPLTIALYLNLNILSPTVLTPSAGQTIDGSTLDFLHNAYVLKLDTVGGGSAAEVAAAMNNAYKVAGSAGSASTTQITPGENLEVVGQTTSGNTVIYDFGNWQQTNTSIGYFPIGNPDLNANHQVDPGELHFVGTLVGVTTAALTAHDF